jgi:hypothetical protein
MVKAGDKITYLNFGELKTAIVQRYSNEIVFIATPYGNRWIHLVSVESVNGKPVNFRDQ